MSSRSARASLSPRAAREHSQDHRGGVEEDLEKVNTALQNLFSDKASHRHHEISRASTTPQRLGNEISGAFEQHGHESSRSPSNRALATKQSSPSSHGARSAMSVSVSPGTRAPNPANKHHGAGRSGQNSDGKTAPGAYADQSSIFKHLEQYDLKGSPARPAVPRPAVPRPAGKPAKRLGTNVAARPRTNATQQAPNTHKMTSAVGASASQTDQAANVGAKRRPALAPMTTKQVEGIARHLAGRARAVESRQPRMQATHVSQQMHNEHTHEPLVDGANRLQFTENIRDTGTSNQLGSERGPRYNFRHAQTPASRSKSRSDEEMQD